MARSTPAPLGARKPCLATVQSRHPPGRRRRGRVGLSVAGAHGAGSFWRRRQRPLHACCHPRLGCHDVDILAILAHALAASVDRFIIRKGVLPRLLEEILSTRIMVKQAMKKLSPSQQVLHRSLQTALFSVAVEHSKQQYHLSTSIFCGKLGLCMVILTVSYPISKEKSQGLDPNMRDIESKLRQIEEDPEGAGKPACVMVQAAATEDSSCAKELQKDGTSNLNFELELDSLSRDVVIEKAKIENGWATKFFEDAARGRAPTLMFMTFVDNFPACRQLEALPFLDPLKHFRGALFYYQRLA
ncbi:hypothetical protein ZEAMMB73_Zm00001d044437 [Zea mays]|uniref:Uncharacterized protein n=1 Tax=Zea mays TaxID=4577 RepID=A0A1D6NLS5_MAIZE|nr:hypothetical protein ZEAMMB73_Zm00001d044437 [Zea mays]